jgi:hypothetical protein
MQLFIGMTAMTALMIVFFVKAMGLSRLTGLIVFIGAVLAFGIVSMPLSTDKGVLCVLAAAALMIWATILSAKRQRRLREQRQENGKRT